MDSDIGIVRLPSVTTGGAGRGPARLGHLKPEFQILNTEIKIGFTEQNRNIDCV